MALNVSWAGWFFLKCFPDHAWEQKKCFAFFLNPQAMGHQKSDRRDIFPLCQSCRKSRNSRCCSLFDEYYPFVRLNKPLPRSQRTGSSSKNDNQAMFASRAVKRPRGDTKVRVESIWDQQYHIFVYLQCIWRECYFSHDLCFQKVRGHFEMLGAFARKGVWS